LLKLREERRLRVFENRVLRRMFTPKRDKVTGEWRKLHNELHDMYSSPNIVRVIKLRRMRWAGHVGQMGREACIRFWWGNPGVGERIILEWIFRNWDVGVWTGLDWLRIETGGEQL
jgi:hypothetical protein